MTRKLLLPLLLLTLLLTACAAKTVAPRSGTYRMSAPPEAVLVPSLTLDAKNKTYLFSYDMLSSYLPVGSYEQDGNVIVCLTEDGRDPYLFRVVNETTLAFIAEGSASVTLTDPRIGEAVMDGSVFLLSN